ncbi:hypothetical protein PR048_016476 [Dryococelus australis]|uniref:Uncharacterized protein n=1 Tax=Dryococelus australis TaxID=614101 RepID=A0ABQ9HK93_9NEOP|nr:hypothetical protein PR048_016476 [Dryococelus australis]
MPNDSELFLSLSLEKCKFAVLEVNYHGYIISTEGVKPNPKPIEGITNDPASTVVKKHQVEGPKWTSHAWALRLSKFSDTVEHRPVEFHINADELCPTVRLPILLSKKTCRQPNSKIQHTNNGFQLCCSFEGVATVAGKQQIKESHRSIGGLNEKTMSTTT